LSSSSSSSSSINAALTRWGERNRLI
jgi:hypothetical protein